MPGIWERSVFLLIKQQAEKGTERESVSYFKEQLWTKQEEIQMNLYLYVIFRAVSFLASVAGAICGIGGGVLIKPIWMLSECSV